MQKPRQPSCSSIIALKKCQRHPLRISCPVMTLAVSMPLINENIKKQRESENQRPASHSTFIFKVGRTFRQQLIRLEKQTSTHYKKRVREISNYNNRSRAICGLFWF